MHEGGCSYTPFHFFQLSCGLNITIPDVQVKERLREDKDFVQNHTANK
jgi:hypothetical protein